MNTANGLTGLRVVLALLLFGLLAYLNGVAPNDELHNQPELVRLGTVALAVYLIALGTDVLDGLMARAAQNETSLGRYADPLADKILICGSLIMLLGLPSEPVNEVLREWMVVVVVAREFAVQGIRGGMEKRGFEYPALAWGKMKMVIQSITVMGLLIYGLYAPGARQIYIVTTALVWLMVISTILSGLVYLYHTVRLLQKHRTTTG